MLACEDEFGISTEILSLLIDVVGLIINIIMLVGVEYMISVPNVVAVIGCMEGNQQQMYNSSWLHINFIKIKDKPIGFDS